MGYTRLDNTLIDVLCKVTLSGYQHRIVMALLRLTAGYNTTETEASYSYLASITDIPRSHVHRTVKSLVERSIITVTTNGNSPTSKSVFRFNPVDKWLLLPVQCATVTTNGNSTVTTNGNTPLYTKKTIKTTINKNRENPLALARLSLFTATEKPYAKRLPILIASGVENALIVEIVRAAISLYSTRGWKECFAKVQMACHRKFPAVEISGSLRACLNKKTPPADYTAYFFACLHKHGNAIGDAEWMRVWPGIRTGHYDTLKSISDILDKRGVV